MVYIPSRALTIPQTTLEICWYNKFLINASAGNLDNIHTSFFPCEMNMLITTIFVYKQVKLQE